MGKNHRIAGNWQLSTTTVAYLTKKMECWHQIHVTTFEGRGRMDGGRRTSLLLPPGAENPSYTTATQLSDYVHAYARHNLSDASPHSKLTDTS